MTVTGVTTTPNYRRPSYRLEYPSGKYPYGIATADQVAAPVVFLASDQAAAYITGTEIHTDIARSLL